MEVFQTIATIVGCISTFIALLITIIKPLRQKLIDSVVSKAKDSKRDEKIDKMDQKLDKLLKANKATVEVLSSSDKWFGVTYQEDKPFVKASIAELKEKGLYPKKLW